MATGSGKTLVMVKLIEYLHSLIQHREISPHNILILAPSDHLIKQIQRAVDEFNQVGLHIDLIPLRERHHKHQGRLGNATTVYYHRSDNISDVQKDALTDYRGYENGGKWYVFLDEAHKGGKEDSKRQAYYAVMARDGFLFNFSATFTDPQDIVTTVKKYNLQEFVKNGHGKNIYLNDVEYNAFKNRVEEISHDKRRKIVLKSLITLAYVCLRIKELRRYTGLEEKLYHLPLMLTLVNSVNTNIENERNDLWAFFQTLREIASGEIDEAIFQTLKDELVNDWSKGSMLFGEDAGGIIGTDKTSVTEMEIADLRKSVFLSSEKGSLQLIRSNDNKELAFQMKNADDPFALIRIGDTSKWRKDLLVGYEETSTLREESFFDDLEQSSITILMGSRSFFESWDSNRPNVINFINIGGADAKKFVVQSVGRGVRIETLRGKRRRLAFLSSNDADEKILQSCHDRVQPAETLFLFATNRNAVKSVLEGLQAEKIGVFERIEGFAKSEKPKVNGKEMPLLIPEYKDVKGNDARRAKFAMSNETLNRFKGWVQGTSDSVFAVRDNLSIEEIQGLRDTTEGQNVQIKPEKSYVSLSFLQNRITSHLAKMGKTTDQVRELNEYEDIVHFRQIRIHAEYVSKLQEKVCQVKKGKLSDEELTELFEQFQRKEITREEYDNRSSGKTQETFKDLTIKKLLGHYYLPVILGDEKAHYIKHIIKVKSEIDFLTALEEWVGKNEVNCDGWMFSKIDEGLDNVHIPYYDSSKNEYRRFLPDFVFWTCRDDEYRIVFVDPKGVEHASSYRKIDGYRQLFIKDNAFRIFNYGKHKVSVALLFYNPQSNPLDYYTNFWIESPSQIFV